MPDNSDQSRQEDKTILGHQTEATPLKWMPLRLAGLYILFGCIWIIASDRVLQIILPHPEAYLIGQTYKGWAFVVVTALLFFFLLRNYQHTVDSMYKKLERTEHARRAIQQSSQNLICLSDEREFLEKACEGAVHFGGYAMAWIALADENEQDRISPVAYHNRLQNDAHGIPDCHLNSRNKDTPPYQVIKTGQSRSYNDLKKGSDDSLWREKALQSGYRSLIVFPLKVDGQCIGAFSLYDDQPNAFQDNEKQLLGELASSLSFGIETLRQRREAAKAQEALRERERQLTTLMKNLPGMAYRCRYDQQWTMDFVSEGASSLLGYDPEDLINNNEIAYNALIHPDDQTMVHETIDAALENHESFELIYRIQSAHGSEKWVWERGQGVLDEDGEVVAIEGFITDITDQKETEEDLQQALSELKNTQQQLIKQERRRALTTMASGIAHNFNNALATIKGFADLLLEQPGKLDDKDTVHHYVDLIHSAAEKATTTVQRLRTFYRPMDDDEFEQVDLNEVVRDAVSITRPRWEHEAQAAGQNIDVQVELSDIPLIHASEAELHELLSNLIFNAVEAIQQDGEIIISTSIDDDQIVIEVADDGAGMDEETRQRCLDPFYTTKIETGSGLGLSTAAGIVKRHSGTINIQSTPGSGTTFHITFPVSREEQPDEDFANNVAPVSPLDILVVEDDLAQRDLLDEILETNGHETVLARDGKEALKIFQNNNFDVVLTDRAMPGMSGDELVEHIISQKPDQPIIMLTGFGEMMNFSAEKPEGVDVILSKPADIHQINNGLRQALGEYAK